MWGSVTVRLHVQYVLQPWSYNKVVSTRHFVAIAENEMLINTKWTNSLTKMKRKYKLFTRPTCAHKTFRFQGSRGRVDLSMIRNNCWPIGAVGAYVKRKWNLPARKILGQDISLILTPWKFGEKNNSKSTIERLFVMYIENWLCWQKPHAETDFALMHSP